MKKLPYMFIAALMAFASCGNEENNEPEKPAPSRDSRLEVVSDNVHQHGELDIRHI